MLPFIAWAKPPGPEGVKQALRVLDGRQAKVRLLELSYRSDCAFLIFTDGACKGEPRKGSVEGVLIRLRGEPVFFLS